MGTLGQDRVTENGRSFFFTICKGGQKKRCGAEGGRWKMDLVG